MLTQAALAVKLDVTQSVVARWEKDQVQPRTKGLERIAQAWKLRYGRGFAEAFRPVPTRPAITKTL